MKASLLFSKLLEVLPPTSNMLKRNLRSIPTLKHDNYQLFIFWPLIYNHFNLIAIHDHHGPQIQAKLPPSLVTETTPHQNLKIGRQQKVQLPSQQLGHRFFLERYRQLTHPYSIEPVTTHAPIGRQLTSKFFTKLQKHRREEKTL